MVVALFALFLSIFREIQCVGGYYLHKVLITTFFSFNRMWRGFLGSTLSSVDLILFSFYMFAIAPNQLRMNLVRHLLSDPTGSTMIKTYLTL